MKKNISEELIKRYLAGNSSESEKALVDEWFASFEQAEDYISDLPDNERDQIRIKLLENIKKNIQEADLNTSANHEANIIRFPKIKGAKTFAFYATRVAALLVFACGLGVLGFKYWTPSEAEAPIAKQILFANNDKLLKKVILPDGSKVWLHENSTLVVSGDFRNGQRMVALAGEAFFDVAKDKAHPFVIKTGHVTTRVLGTSFHIKAYEEASSVEVNVVSGKVSVYKSNPAAESSAARINEKEAVVLMPHQKVTFLKENKDLIKLNVPINERRMVWAKASISFENTPIRQVIKLLNTKFNANIKLTNTYINNCSIHGVFTEQNLPEILEVICKSIEAEYHFYKEEIIISGEGCPPNEIMP